MDEADYRNIAQDVFKLLGDELEAFVKEKLHRDRNLKTGDNVIHVVYYSYITPESDVEELRDALKENSIELSYQDQINSMQASVVDVLTSILISYPIAKWIFENIAWNLVQKYFLKSVAATRAGIIRIRGEASEKDKNAIHQISFRIESGLVNLQVPSHSDPEVAKQALKTMEKITKIYLEKRNEMPPHIYDQWRMDENGQWKRLNRRMKKKRITFRDATVRDLKKDYSDLKVRKGKDRYSFFVTADKLVFKNSFESGDFFDALEQTDAKYAFTIDDKQLVVAVSNYKGSCIGS